LIWIVKMRGAKGESSGRACSSTLAISFRTWRRALRAFSRRLRHDRELDAGDLEVHLDRGDALRGAADLEVHVAEVVLGAQDVGEDGASLPFLDQPHRDPAQGAFIGHPASINASEPAAHVAIEEEPLDSRSRRRRRRV
jgi:hypothetical protein